jgi:glycosyltransferase involved in cell wall biosynthesis
MSTAQDEHRRSAVRDTATTLEIAVPVHNEERDLEHSVRRLRHYLDTRFPVTTVVTIADNASTDATWSIAERIADELEGVRAVRLDRKGRGRALRAVWGASPARVVAYMDVDLATDLDALLPLVAPLISGHSDVAIGTRLAPGARVIRGPMREVISRCYNLIVRTALRSQFTDAQCGFKAARADAARALLPLVEDDEWFFDTELLVVAERNGLRIHEVAVDWIDRADSRVDIAQTAAADLRGIGRLVRDFASGRGVGRSAAADLRRSYRGDELASFARIGVLSTVAWLLLWLALRPALGAFAANALALVICSVPNTAANWRLTFAGRAPFRRQDQVVGGLAVLAASLVATTFALAVALGAGATSAAAEGVALLLANAVVAFVRFVLLRAWIFRGLAGPGGQPEDATGPHGRSDHEGSRLGSARS